MGVMTTYELLINILLVIQTISTNNIESKEVVVAEEIGTILSGELCSGEDESISH